VLPFDQLGSAHAERIRSPLVELSGGILEIPLCVC